MDDTVIEARPDNPKAYEWAGRIGAQQRSRMSVKQFCKERGLTEYSFYAWRNGSRRKGPCGSLRFGGKTRDTAGAAGRGGAGTDVGDLSVARTRSGMNSMAFAPMAVRWERDVTACYKGDPCCHSSSHSLVLSASSSAIAPMLRSRFWRFASK
jgi:hypothetical protein